MKSAMTSTLLNLSAEIQLTILRTLVAKSGKVIVGAQDGARLGRMAQGAGFLISRILTGHQTMPSLFIRWRPSTIQLVSMSAFY